MKLVEKGFVQIFAIGFAFSLGMNIGGSLLTMYAAIDFNASSATIGILTAISMLVSMFITLPSGALSDKFGRKPLIILGLISGVVNNVILYLASDIGLLFIAQIMMGFSFPIFAPSMQALAAEFSSPSSSGEAVGFYLLGPSVGMFLGPLIASLLLRFVSIRDTFISSLLVILPSLILALLINPTRSTKRINVSLVNFWGIMKRKSIIGVSFVAASFFFLNSSVMAFYPIYALNEYSADPAIVATVFSLRNLVLMLVRVFTVFKLAPRFGEKKLILVALLASILVAFLPLAQNYQQSAVLIALTGIGHGIIFPMGVMIITKLTSSLERGTANSIYLLYNSITSTTSPILMGFVADAYGLSILFPIIAVFPVIGLVASKYIP